LSLLAESHPFHRQHNDAFESLDSTTSAHPRVRQDFFWQTVERGRAAYPNDRNHFLTTYEFRQVLKLQKGDLDWMIQDIRIRPDPADRLLILSIAIRLATSFGDRRLTRLQAA